MIIIIVTVSQQRCCDLRDIRRVCSVSRSHTGKLLEALNSLPDPCSHKGVIFSQYRERHKQVRHGAINLN